MPAADGWRRDHQPAAARRQHGVHPFSRRHFDRAVAEGTRTSAKGAVGLDAQYRRLVGQTQPVPSMAGSGRLRFFASLESLWKGFLGVDMPRGLTYIPHPRARTRGNSLMTRGGAAR